MTLPEAVRSSLAHAARYISVADDFFRGESDRREDGLRRAAFHPEKSKRLKYNRGDVVVPAAVPWTDADGQRRTVVASPRTLMAGVAVAGEVCCGDAKKHEHGML
ncbi:MAG: hypothetical protein ACOC8H_01725 [bacterium]